MSNQKKSEAFAVALTAAGDNAADLKKVAAAAVTTIAELEAEIDEADALNSDLQEKLEALKSGEKVFPSIKIGDDTYNVLHGVRLNGEVYKPEDIAADADVAAELLKGNSSALAKQAAKATE